MASKREDVDVGPLPLIPIMNMVCLMIPFLLMCSQFIRIGVVLVETPRLSRVKSAEQKDKKEALNLTLVMTDKGYYLKSRNGSECPEGVADDQRLCFPKREGKFDDRVLKALQLHLWYLFAAKYKDESNFSSPEEKHAITIIPEPTVTYDDLVRTLDAMRDIPFDAKNPPLKQAVPATGCKMEYSRKQRAWGFYMKGGVSSKDSACMYWRVTLALGSA
jgi:hypothetical protein